MIDKFVDVYISEEKHQRRKVSAKEARRYFSYVFSQGRLIWRMDGGNVIGLCESWQLNIEQLTRLLSRDKFCIYDEKINEGNICYVMDVWVHPSHRYTGILQSMRRELMERNKSCKFFMGEEFKNNNRLRIIGRKNYGKRKK